MSDLNIEWRGKKYTVDVDSITTREYRAIKRALGLKQGAFIRSFSGFTDDMDADAVAALLWVGQTRAGENVTFADYDELPALDLIGAISSPPEVEADPDDPDVEDGDPKAEESMPTAG